MNVFRLLGDLLHLFCIGFLIYTIHRVKDVKGLSLRTQELYLIVFCTRYVDVFFKFYSVYNTAMKIVYLVSTAYTCYLIGRKFRKTYSEEADWFPKWPLCLGALAVSLALARSYKPMMFLWTFSLWLEAVAIFPQLIVVRRVKQSEVLTKTYMALMGLYRLMYILNWIYRFYTTGWFFINAWLAGVLQTVLYSDFVYQFIAEILSGREFDLPGNAT